MPRTPFELRCAEELGPEEKRGGKKEKWIDSGVDQGKKEKRGRIIIGLAPLKHSSRIGKKKKRGRKIRLSEYTYRNRGERERSVSS